VKDIVATSDEGAQPCGLRLTAAPKGTRARFQLNVGPLPAEDDEVIDEQGARMFLEREAASLLDGKLLDGSVDQNEVAFTIEDQSGR
jgi:iron-sulfur cluster assembly protein